MLDVSLSGLLVQTTLALAQGDDVAIEIEGGVRLKALAWHARVIRRGRETQAAPQAAVAAGGAAPAPHRPKRPPPLPLPVRSSSWWRLRIKQVDGPRTRMVTLAAASKEQAIAQFLAALGGGWEIVDAVASGGAS